MSALHYATAPRVTADDWYDYWLHLILHSSTRRARIARERYERPWDASIRAAREYEAETANLLAFVKGMNNS